MRPNQSKFKLVSWRAIKSIVKTTNPTFFELTDHPYFDDKKCVIASYQYGESIIEQGTVSRDTDEDHAIVARHLSYSPLPLALVLKKSTEVYVRNKRIFPLNLLMEGELFGVFEIASMLNNQYKKPLWSVCAGGLSVFMLPKISESLSHDRLCKELNTELPVPTTLREHHRIFKAIAKTDRSWECQILFFSKDWFCPQSTEILNYGFREYIYKVGWDQLQLYRDAYLFHILGDNFSLEVNRKNLNPKSHLVDTVKYLHSVAQGGYLCFKPAMDSMKVPLELIQDIYTNIYQLNSYAPIVMVPERLAGLDAGYYGMKLPVISDSLPKKNGTRSILQEQRNLKKLVDLFKLIDSNFTHKDTHHYEFFHSTASEPDHIFCSRLIYETDKNFQQACGDFGADGFCSNATFFKGCVRINRKK